MSNVVYHGADIETFADVDLGAWMLSRWPTGTERPRGLVIYKDSVNITQAWITDESLLFDRSATYHLYEVPNGGVLGGITKLLGAVLNPILKLFTPKTATPQGLRNARSPSSNNELQGRTNAPRPGERIPDIRGKVRAFPDLLMDYRIFKDRIEHEVQFLLIGAGEYALTDIRDGITPASNISGLQLSFYKNGTAPRFGDPYLKIGGDIDTIQFPIFVAKSSNEADGAEVRPPNYADVSRARFTGFPTGQLRITIPDDNTNVDWGDRTPASSVIILTDFYSFEPHSTIPNVFIMRDVSGSYTVQSSQTNEITLDINGKEGWQGFVPTGQEIYSSAYERPDGFWQFASGVETRLRKFNPSLDTTEPYVVGPYLLDRADKVLVNLYARNGMYLSNGDIFTESCNFAVTLSDPNRIQPSVVHTMSVRGKFTEAVGETLIAQNPFNGPVNVSVRRTSDTNKNWEGNVVDSVVWRDLYAIQDIGPRSYGDVTLCQAVQRATNTAVKQKEKKLNMLATRVHNGVASDNFADVIVSMHTDPLFGRRTLQSLDVQDLYAVQQRTLDYFGDPRSIQCGYTFDDVKTTYEDALNIICSPVNVTPFQIGSSLHFWSELPQPVSAMQFGHAFKVPGTDRRTRSFSPPRNFTGVQIKYYDHTAQSYLYVTKGEQNNLNKIDLAACQSRYLAEIKANREYNKQLYQRISHDTSTFSIGLQTAPGMRVDMIDNTRLKQSEGTVESVNGLMLLLSDPVESVPGGVYSITLTSRVGTIENIPVTLTQDPFTVMLTRQPTVDVYTGWLRDKTAYVVRADDQRSKLAMLVQSMQPSGRDDNYKVGLTCINYDDRYYKDDK